MGVWTGRPMAKQIFENPPKIGSRGGGTRHALPVLHQQLAAVPIEVRDAVAVDVDLILIAVVPLALTFDHLCESAQTERFATKLK